MRMMLLRTVAAALGTVGTAQAFEPPRPPVMAALEASQVAVIARVQGLQEIERRPTHTVARASLVVLKCLRGRVCRQRSTLQMTYTPETIRDGALGVNFLLGREYLLLFKQDPGQRLAFGTTWPRQMDVAFLLLTPLRPLQSMLPPDPATDVLSFENVWGGPPQSLDLAALEAWAAQKGHERSGPPR